MKGKQESNEKWSSYSVQLSFDVPPLPYTKDGKIPCLCSGNLVYRHPLFSSHHEFPNLFEVKVLPGYFLSVDNLQQFSSLWKFTVVGLVIIYPQQALGEGVVRGGHGGSEDFSCVTIKFTWSPTRLCNILMIPLHPLTPMSDQNRISPYSINPISSRQVVRIKKYINLGIISWFNTKFSELTW